MLDNMATQIMDSKLPFFRYVFLPFMLTCVQLFTSPSVFTNNVSFPAINWKVQFLNSTDRAYVVCVGEQSCRQYSTDIVQRTLYTEATRLSQPG